MQCNQDILDYIQLFLVNQGYKSVSLEDKLVTSGIDSLDLIYLIIQLEDKFPDSFKASNFSDRDLTKITLEELVCTVQ